MNNKLPLIVGLVIAGAIGAFLYFRQAGGPIGDVIDGDISPRTFAELMALGENYTCDFQNVDEAGNNTSGTVYIADRGNRLSGDFELEQANGNTMQSHIIRDGEYNYVWGIFDESGEEVGYKMKVDPEDQGLFPETGEDTERNPFNEDEEVDFDCRRWNPDNRMFVPPSDVEFTDFSAQMELMEQQAEQAEEYLNQGTQQQIDCSVCDQVPAGQGRDQCLATLGC